MRRFLFLSLLIVIAITSCKKPRSEGQQDDHLPYFGFNARGNISPDEQIVYADAYFKQFSPSMKNKLTIRVTGGTQSQVTFPTDWSDQTIAKWVNLQHTYNLRFIFVVNGNDTPLSQKNFLQRWIDAGAHFDFIEMMNEYYLKKYAIGDISNDEVTEKVSPQYYTDTILPRFWNKLDVFQLPYYIILAPVADGNIQAYYAAWNDSIVNAVKNKYPSRNLNTTLHLYLRGVGSAFDYTQISNLKMRLPSSSHLAITEAGIIDSTINYEQAGAAAIAHYKKILPYLDEGDYLLDQVLYNNFIYNNTANLSPQYNGITPKGTAILSFVNNGLQ